MPEQSEFKIPGAVSSLAKRASPDASNADSSSASASASARDGSSLQSQVESARKQAERTKMARSGGRISTTATETTTTATSTAGADFSTSAVASSSFSAKLPVSVPAKSHKGHCNNPQCAHCGTVIIPSPRATYPINDSPSISVGDWEIYTVRKPILNAVEIDDYEAKLNLPLPEMIFGKNEIRVANTKHGWSIVFNSIDALDTVLKIGCDPGKLLKVAHSNDWFEYRQSKAPKSDETGALGTSGAQSPTTTTLSSEYYNEEVPQEDLSKYVTKMVKPYDWTYTPDYKGTVKGSQHFTEGTQQIPINKLKVPDPILFFDDLVLYEDELADNGISILSCKIRVMEQRLLLLLRFFLRIDNVIFRVKDVRIFVEFSENLIIRDVKEQEDTYANVYRKSLRSSIGEDPRINLRDSNWVSSHLPVKSHSVEEILLQ